MFARRILIYEAISTIRTEGVHKQPFQKADCDIGVSSRKWGDSVGYLANTQVTARIRSLLRIHDLKSNEPLQTHSKTFSENSRTDTKLPIESRECFILGTSCLVTLVTFSNKYICTYFIFYLE